MATLLLRLGAPLQSWGISSYYDTRETDAFPTKSGVIGMLAAALGRRRDAALADLVALEFGVRIDAPGTRLHDFQTTNMGEKLNANLSDRVYLSDALFLAGLSCEDRTELEELSEALDHPVFAPFLGRRSCPPTLPLNLGIREAGLQQALEDEPWLLAEHRQREALKRHGADRLRIIMDAGADRGAIRRDVPVSFSPFKRDYGCRYVTEIHTAGGVRERSLPQAEHDPMTELE